MKHVPKQLTCQNELFVSVEIYEPCPNFPKCTKANDSALMEAVWQKCAADTTFNFPLLPSGAYVTSTAVATMKTRCAPLTETPTTTPVWSERRRA